MTSSQEFWETLGSRNLLTKQELQLSGNKHISYGHHAVGENNLSYLPPGVTRNKTILTILMVVDKIEIDISLRTLSYIFIVGGFLKITFLNFKLPMHMGVP